MAGYQDLSEFERGVKVGTREMEHSISEAAMKFGFSRTTISRVYREYQESGFRSRRPTRVLLLTARHKALRLARDRQHRHWTVDDWKHVSWYEKSLFQLNRADGRVQVWRHPHESMDPTF
ncbi:uncharacterized protein TNCV_1972711 [Trichonephila clavipes]|nr:uncharacterized protein TNCV_1972711 [Trichonephila clavipes]